MSKVINQPAINEVHINDLRNAYEHRATWFYFLLDEARKRGLEWKDFAREAVFRCGCYHGSNFENKISCKSSLLEFSRLFVNELSKKVFEMEIEACDEDRLYINFHYCPLVSAWQKQGCSEEDMAELCDIAMDGDRGIASRFNDFTFRIDGTIAEGCPMCKIRFNKKK